MDETYLAKTRRMVLLYGEHCTPVRLSQLKAVDVRNPNIINCFCLWRTDRRAIAARCA